MTQTSPVRSTSSDPTPTWVPLVGVGIVSLVILGVMRPDLIFSANTPAGGDMGAHVLGPAFLRDQLLPSGQILGWSNSWFAGFPIFYFYFPLPSLVIVLFDLVMPYGVAFKLVTVMGLLATPPAAYFLARSIGMNRAVATVAGAAGGSFVFIESFTIYGANIASTLAGEFSFSWSFALALVYFGLLTRGLRDDPGLLPVAALFLGLTALSHIIVTIVVVLATLPMLVWRRAAGRVVFTWIAGFLVAGFWALPLLARFGLTADMAWSPLKAWDELFPIEIWPIVPLAVAGMIWAVRKTVRAVPVVGMTLIPFIYFWLPVAFAEDPWKLWNGRLLPFWFFGLTFFAPETTEELGRLLENLTLDPEGLINATERSDQGSQNGERWSASAKRHIGEQRKGFQEPSARHRREAVRKGRAVMRGRNAGDGPNAIEPVGSVGPSRRRR